MYLFYKINLLIEKMLNKTLEYMIFQFVGKYLTGHSKLNNKVSKLLTLTR